MKLLLVFLCVAAVFCSPPRPDLPSEFSANVQIQLPMMPVMDGGRMYYDFPNLRQRVDVSFGGNSHIQLDLYAQHVRYQIQKFAGFEDCKLSPLDEPMSPMALPPFAHYDGNSTIRGQNCMHWSITLGSIGLHWYTKGDTLVRVEMNTMGMNTRMDFFNVTAGPQADSLFDQSQWNCPAPIPPVRHSVGGYIKDATNNRPVSHATVAMTSTSFNGIHLSTKADVNGEFTFAELPEGTYTMTAEATNYAKNSKSLEVKKDIQAGSAADMFLSPKLPAGQWRFVLSWGPRPLDLDAHMKTATGCHVSYRHRHCQTAVLDHDARAGYGPETITVTNRSPGVYKYFVHRFSSGKFSESQAVVKIYNEHGLAHTISLPDASSYADTSRYWNVATLSSNGITVVNRVVSSEP
eukprot:gnl/Trimastix_PCT/649.p2 GENE.gnl/Trimastix_PCT/649~~gnl/Trimastix_PCT/649.p2  ORF type:complete len:406 (+),score=142.27 gnl/Trimastix_PCT/649:76-1293(+)